MMWCVAVCENTTAIKIVTGVLFFLVFSPLHAALPLVDANWLQANLNKPNLVILDLQPSTAYQRFHIPGAVNSNLANWRKANAKGVPQMLPSITELEQLIGNLGIDNQTHVVLVITGRYAGEMASATRVYWTLNALGHKDVSILDGGLIAYAENRSNTMESKVNRPRNKRTFKANLKPEYMITADIVKASLNSSVTMVDNRSGAEYMGLVSGGGSERQGTIPGAINLPYNWLTVNGGARFHSTDNLQRIFKVVGVPLEGEQISFCHTGLRTSLAWFVAHELLGNKKAQMYEGSTAEWADNSSLPIERKIKLN